jgi:ABC-type amino acid transport substrate-binding protein
VIVHPLFLEFPAINRTTNTVRVLVRAMVVVVVVAVWAESALALSGQIKSVDDAARRLVVTEIGTNRDFNFAVSPQATIVTATNRAFDFGRLKAGDGVAVTFDGDLAVRIARRLLWATSSRLTSPRVRWSCSNRERIGRSPWRLTRKCP